MNPNPLAVHGGSTAAMLTLLERWSATGWLRPLDHAFASFLANEVPAASPLLLLAAALASHQLGRGHACLDLAAVLADPGLALSLPPEGEVLAESAAETPPLPAVLLTTLTLPAWKSTLACPQLLNNGPDGPGGTPLVLRGDRLYLRRYWQYEADVRAALAQRLSLAEGVDAAALRRTLAVLFPQKTGGMVPDWQQVACALAALKRFAIITGGPGTGKTTTVVRLLAVLQALELEAARAPLVIRLAAPTGKAAARLNSAIATAVDALVLDGLSQAEQVRQAIPRQVVTVHRLLGSRPDSRRFRHGPGQALELDLLVIDEASMIDLELMASVLAALPAKARLILLGDKDQLASVEAGAVLGQLCARAAAGRYTPASVALLAGTCGVTLPASLVDDAGTDLEQSVVMLRHSHRFAAGSGIGQLAAAVNAGDAAKAEQAFAAAHPDLSLIELAAGSERHLAADQDFFRCCIDSGYRPYLELIQQTRPASGATVSEIDAWAAAVLAAHAHFQVLCALRAGPWGIEGLNARIATGLQAAGLIERSEGWYEGRPVLVTRNDYALGLMNGDIGITLRVPDVGAAGGDAGNRLRVVFPAADGEGVRWVLPSRLLAVETVYALTVHKSQGSEFTHAVLVLPDRLNPILTRELIYTGITRARSQFTLAGIAATEVLGAAVQRCVLRSGGLLEGGS